MSMILLYQILEITTIQHQIIQPNLYTFNNELVWSDEFDQDGPVSQDKWNVETIPPNNGSWWNGELQFYTDKEDNIRVEEGLLKITAKYESYEGKNYTSARINTQDKFEFIYGRVEMRAKLPNWEGMWPAFWYLAQILMKLVGLIVVS